MESQRIILDQLGCITDLNSLAKPDQTKKQLPYLKETKWAKDIGGLF